MAISQTLAALTCSGSSAINAATAAKLDIGAGWHAALHQLDFLHLPVTGLHAERVEHLPWHHHDPFDRLLVAQAQLEECRLVTSNARLAAYDVEIVW